MNTYNVTVEQVSKSRNRAFAILVNKKHIAEIFVPAPSFGSDYGHEKFVSTVFEYAYQVARRVIIHSMNNDVDVFTNGTATMDFGNYKIIWATK